jgi:hypothetical protein
MTQLFGRIISLIPPSPLLLPPPPPPSPSPPSLGTVGGGNCLYTTRLIAHTVL